MMNIQRDTVVLINIVVIVQKLDKMLSENESYHIINRIVYIYVDIVMVIRVLDEIVLISYIYIYI